MLRTIDHENRTREHVALRSMFIARKRIFVDLLKWDLPVLAGRFEVDPFDDPRATYLIVTDAAGEHLASARLLPTTRPASLDRLFPIVAGDSVPKGPGIAEITRFCLSPDVPARARRAARDMLITGLIEHAMSSGIRSFRCVAACPWFRRINRLGWACRAIGAPFAYRGRQLIAFRIDIDGTSLAKLAAGGMAPVPAPSPEPGDAG